MSINHENSSYLARIQPRLTFNDSLGEHTYFTDTPGVWVKKANLQSIGALIDRGTEKDVKQ